MTDSFWFWFLLAWVLAIGFTVLRACDVIDFSPASTLLVALLGMRGVYALWDKDWPRS